LAPDEKYVWLMKELFGFSLNELCPDEARGLPATRQERNDIVHRGTFSKKATAERAMNLAVSIVRKVNRALRSSEDRGMSWSEVQRGKEVVKKIVADINNRLVCEIPEPIGDDFDRDLYPVILKGRGKSIRLKIPMEDLEDIVADKSVQRKIRQLLERIIQQKVA
jgi:hypothetical protein